MSIKNIETYESLVKGSTEDKKTILFNFRKTYPAYIILIVMIAASFLVMDFIKSSVESDRKLAFEKASNSLVSRINDHTNNIMSVQWTMHNLFKNTYVVRGVFELNGMNAVNTYESLKSINYVYKVKDSFLKQFVFETRSQGYYDLKVHPKADRETYYIVEFVVPFEGNEDRSGFDYASDDIAMEYINESAVKDTIMVTPVYEFRKDIEGFQIVSPVYTKGSTPENEKERLREYKGSLILEIESDSFFKNAIGEGVASDSSVYFTISEKVKDEEKSIYKSDNYSDFDNLSSFVPAVQDRRTFTIASKEYFIDLNTIPGFGGVTQEYLPYIALVISLIIGFILFAFLISVITARERAEDIADKITRSQRRIVDTSNDIIGITDISGEWKTLNNATMSIFDKDPEELLDTSIKEMFSKHEDEVEFAKAIVQTQDDKAFNQTAVMEVNGKKKWIDWNFSISKVDGLIYAIGRDVTLEKEAEEQAYVRTKQINLAEHFATEANVSKSYLIRDISDRIMGLVEDNLDDIKRISELDVDFPEEESKSLMDIEEKSTILYKIIDGVKEGTMVSDIDQNIVINRINFIKEIKEIINDFEARQGDNFVIDAEFNQIEELIIYANQDSLKESFMTLFKLLSPKGEKTELSLQLQKNEYENVMEMEIMASPDEKLSRMIKLHKENRTNIIDAMPQDEDDYLYNIAVVESDFRRMNGAMTLESLGEGAENLVIITIPLNR